jgi:hypothetical protein
MTDKEAQRRSEPGRPMSTRTIAVGSALVVVGGALIVTALVYFYGHGTDQDRAKLDLVRTAGTLVALIGGFITLLLAALRQRSTELTLEHQREVAATAAQDAIEQRITELYSRAVEQLGSDKAPVRLGGLYALERLAQNELPQRQTIVDVICAYLRMPYTPPEDQSSAANIRTELYSLHEERRQELQVRLAAQRILAAHLRSDTTNNFWTDMNLDLTGAHIHGLFDLTNCRIRWAQFRGARFTGNAVFAQAEFTGDANFSEAQFAIDVSFDRAFFAGAASFEKAWISADASFHKTHFSGIAGFHSASFRGAALFYGATFSGVAWLGKAQFSGFVGFDGARARSTTKNPISHSWPAGWSTREAIKGEDPDWKYLVHVENPTT